jgi:hypothetical protein
MNSGGTSAWRPDGRPAPHAQTGLPTQGHGEADIDSLPATPVPNTPAQLPHLAGKRERGTRTASGIRVPPPP